MTDTTTAPLDTQLRERLEAAERLCWMFGWTGVTDDSPRDKAAAILWRRWYATQSKADEKAAIKAMPDKWVDALAAEYDSHKKVMRAKLDQIIEVVPAGG